ncbi:nucleotidyltransferase family protein [Bradyrhizobium sp. CNPSo 4010]|uniref:Nucleotidyltransferase family protein n=1 Tax=Bradyrhizobium agreste TaxID=2751811 RepID=A0ABS0PM41_9BRAD|nr:nucleotidyltransferase family protein [Bradyrhizobium agreste]MBH5398256.1 nucleotidyltransferase family protein [Bradyrhizobium agreste]
MASHISAFDTLCDCLRGTLPAHVDWVSLIGLANKTLTTPALIDLVDKFERHIPEDVCTYVRHIYQRNLTRNNHLTAQLTQAIVAMNEQGVTPIVFKGAAMLATTPYSRRGTRLMADLDLLVAPCQTEAALAALAGIGYVVHFQAPADSENWYADLKRPHDVGMIDLHRGAPGPAYFYRASGPVISHCKPVSVGPGSAYIPTPTYHALILMLHDQFQDYDYWVGQLDLRHLLELRDLANSSAGIDWDRLASFAPDKLAQNAIETQFVALAKLFGVEVPPNMRSRLIPRLQFLRKLMQARFPITRWPLLLTTVLDYGNYRRGPGAQFRAAAGLPGGSWSPPRLGTVRFILDIAAKDRAGKA